MIILPIGLLQGDRLAQCSDEAQLHFPRIVALANGFGRVELRASKIAELAYAHMKVRPTAAQLAEWMGEYQRNHLVFIYSTPSGEVWGQFLMPKDAYPRFKTSADKRSPAPVASEFEAFAEAYQRTKSVKAADECDYLKISEHFERLPKSSEPLETFPCGIGIGIGIGVGVGIGEVQEQRLLSVQKPEAHKIADRFLEAWNSHCCNLPKAQKLTVERRRKVTARVAEGLRVERFTEAVKLAARTPFLRGEGSGSKWRCDFDFIIANETNLLKILEGKYGAPDKPKTIFVELAPDEWGALA